MARTPPAAHPDDQVSLTIAAPAERLYDLVADVPRMGRLSPECTGGKWSRGSTGPAAGARFKGRNKRGLARWSTSNTVVAAERGREFAFETKQSATRWRYRFEPAGDATIVTESREATDDRPLIARIYARFALGGVDHHEDEMRTGMLATLERLKAVAEASEPPSRRRRRGRSRR